MVAINTWSTTIASASSRGIQADDGSAGADISANGRWVVFESTADTLGFGPNPSGGRDVYLRDTMTGQTRLVSAGLDGEIVAADSSNASVSEDGRYVTFTSSSRSLVPGDTSTGVQVYVRDMQEQATYRVSENAGAAPTIDSINPQISADGRYIVYETTGTVVTPDTNGAIRDIFRYDQLTGESALI